MTRGNEIVIGGTTVRPGQRVDITLPVASLYTATSIGMPVHVICGRKAGPTLFVSAAIHGDELNGGTSMSLPVAVLHGRSEGPVIWLSSTVHGDELNGVEIIRRLLRRKVIGTVRGTLIAVPIVNVHGFLDQSRYLPDRRDLNRSFPGSPRGSIAARLANRFIEEIVSKADYGIDLHAY